MQATGTNGLAFTPFVCHRARLRRAAERQPADALPDGDIARVLNPRNPRNPLVRS
jgi:hypothetical protein